MSTQFGTSMRSGEEVDPSSVDWDGADFVWRSESERIAAFGAALVITADVNESLAAKVKSALSDIDPESAPIAVGALPFDPSVERQLIVPAEVFRLSSDGHAFRTRIEGPSSEFPVASIPTGIESHDEAGYKQLVANAIDVLHKYDMHKMAIARRFELRVDQQLDRSAIVGHLIKSATQSFVFAHGGFVGATPELLVRRTGNRGWSEPMAGTMPIDAAISPEDLASKMFTASKTHEHAPTPAHVSEVFSRVGNVTVHDTEARLFPTLAHLVTRVEVAASDRLTDALSLVEMLHPTPAVGTSPAKEFRRVREVEQFDRRFYAGPVGWVDANGDGEWAIALRCGEIGNKSAILTAGNGITKMSEPHEEWLETESKLAVMIEAINSTLQDG